MQRKKSDGKVIIFALLAGLFLMGIANTAMAEGSKWHVDLEYLYLTEIANGENLFEENGDKTNTEDLLASWGDGFYNSGWRAEIGYDMPSNWGLSFAYIGRIAKGEIVLNSPGEDIDDLLDIGGEFGSAGQVRMLFDTDLHSFELNILAPPWKLSECTQLRAFFGPRFILLKDDMDIEGYDDWPPQSDPDDRMDLYVDTENFLYALQGGLGYTWEYCDWFRFFTGVKAGVYYADMDNKVKFREYDGDQDKWKLKDDDDDIGFLGEAMVSAEVKIYKNLSARLGYMLLYLSDTCRAVNQLQEGMNLDQDLVDIPSSDYPDVEKDYTLYHGLMAGIVLRW